MADDGKNLMSVDEGLGTASSTGRGLVFLKESLELFFGFFFGPLFLYGFGGFLFGFFSCVLTFAHGCAPCMVK